VSRHARQFLDAWPPPLDRLAEAKAYMPVDPTPEQLAEGVWCSACERMVRVREAVFVSNTCWEVAVHGPAADPCPGSGLPCDGERADAEAVEEQARDDLRTGGG